MGVAAALSYLHSYSPPIIHGDVKPVCVVFLIMHLSLDPSRQENVLISYEGNALLCDFGRARFCHRPQRKNSHPSPGGTPRYQAPELSAPEYPPPTEAADVYSFAMLIFCLASGDHPFPASRDTYVRSRILQGDRPSNPNTGLFSHLNGGSLFELLQQMWHQDASKRPTSTLAENRLRKVFQAWKE
jgi:serine/threonine protein kinase